MKLLIVGIANELSKGYRDKVNYHKIRRNNKTE